MELVDIDIVIDEIRIGYFSIDEDHKNMLVAIDEIFQLVENNSPADDVNMSLNRLGNIFFTHFDLEESIMARRDYPECEQHKSEHEYFRNEFEKLKASLSKYSSSVRYGGIDEMKSLLIDCNMNHIKTADRDFGKFIRSIVEKDGPIIV